MVDAELKRLIIYATLVFMMAPASVLLYVFIYNKRKKRHIEEKKQLQVNFNQELLKTQMEVQEQTLNYISREIHDNINQVLSFVKLNLIIKNDAIIDEEVQHKVTESRNLVAQVITDLRDLSKSLSFEHISQMGLYKTIAVEVDRINKSGIIAAQIVLEGEQYNLGEQCELVLFRIFQEAVNNTLKHAGAASINIHLQYLDDIFNLTIEDDGAGFVTGAQQKGGSGLRNMESRAALIGAAMVINSAPGKGCRIKITIHNLTQHTYACNTGTNSRG